MTIIYTDRLREERLKGAAYMIVVCTTGYVAKGLRSTESCWIVPGTIDPSAD
jgi:hypothetical protein